MNKGTLQRLLREPLLHFIAIGGLLFLAYGTLNGTVQEQADNTILITAERITQINNGFYSVWKRNPTDEELDKLIELEVRTEVYYRDALALGLDKNDAGVRRRLQQKLEFLSDTGSYLKDPTGNELDVYFANNQQHYRQSPGLAFEQIFLGENPAEGTVNETLGRLLTEPATDPYSLGQRSSLPPQLRLSTPQTIDSVFGPEFYEQISELAPGKWSGPVTSAYGLHLVRTLDGAPARTPALEDIHATVLKDWKQDKAREARETDYDRRRARFEVEIQRNTN